MKRLVILFLAVLGFLPVFAQENTQKNVLVICPYSTTESWGQTMLKPLFNLEKEEPHYNFFFQTFNNVTLSNTQDYEGHLHSIEQIFSTQAPDLIVIYGTGNYSLIRELDQRWKNVPIIASGELDYISPREYVVDSIARPNIKREPISQLTEEGLNLTFLYTPIFIDGVVDLMQKIIPGMKEIVFIGGDEYQSREVFLKAQKIIQDRGIVFTPLLTSNLSTEEMLGISMSKDTQTTGFLYNNWHRKIKTGQIAERSPREMLQSHVPLFYSYNTDFNRNRDLVGTTGYNLEKYERTISTLIKQVLNQGTAPRDIPFITLEQDRPIVNMAAINKYGLNANNVPVTAQKVNTPLTFLDRNKDLLIGLALVALAGLTVLALFFAARERKIARLNHKSRLILENLPISYDQLKLIYDKDGTVVDARIQQMNKQLQHDFDGLGIRDAVGKTLTEVFPHSGKDFITPINEALKAGKDTIRFPLYLRDGDQYLEVVLVITGTSVHKFAMNTTEQMLTQQQLQVAKEKAEESAQLKTQFVQNMSHEIRTPLNAIVGFSQLLAMPDGFVSDAEKETYATFVQNSSKLLMMLIDDILDLADVENGNYRIELTESPLNQMAYDAVKTVEYRTPPGVKMYFTSDLTDEQTALTDARRVQQVLINYLTNACKHTTRGEIHVHLTDSRTPGYYSYSVTDTGTGIPSGEAENIFERFTKLDAFKQGTGLGLNICRTVAEKLHAKAYLDTTYSGGARFMFELPK